MNALFADLRTNGWRDRLACAICNFVLNHLASEWYRRMIAGSISLGLDAAKSHGLAADINAAEADLRQGRTVPMEDFDFRGDDAFNV